MKPIATFGPYVVSEMYEEKKMMVEKTVLDETGAPSKKRVMIRRSKFYLQLQHSTGATIVFSVYNYCGKQRFKDSREKISRENPNDAISEVVRMLNVDVDMAKKLLGVKEEQKIAA